MRAAATFGRLSDEIVLPQPNDDPAPIPEFCRAFGVSIAIISNLLGPPGGIPFRHCEVY